MSSVVIDLFTEETALCDALDGARAHLKRASNEYRKASRALDKAYLEKKKAAASLVRANKKYQKFAIQFQ
jgi:hypothetical protein